MRTTLLASVLLLTGMGLAHADRQPTEPSGSPPTSQTGSKVVRCVDGTTSTSTGRGACSRHGGVLGPGKIPTEPEEGKVEKEPARGQRCADGTHTTVTGRGACSHRGGLAPASASRLGEPRAMCRDGWISYSAHRGGPCAGHGGVREWLSS